MRKGYKKGFLQRINKRTIVFTMGAIALLILLFFASFWVTTMVLRKDWVVPIPQQSDFVTPSSSAEPDEPDYDHEDNTNKISDAGWGEMPAATQKPADESPAPEASTAPAASSAPQASAKPAMPSTAPSADAPVVPSAKPAETQKPVEKPSPTVAPSKPPIEIISPNVGE